MNQVLGTKVAYFNPTQANFFGAAKVTTSLQGKSPRFIEQLKQGLPKEMQDKVDHAYKTGTPIDSRTRNNIHGHMQRIGPTQNRGQNTNLNTQNGRRQWIGTEGQGYAHRSRFTGNRANSRGMPAQIAQDEGTVPSRRSGRSGSSSVSGVSGRRTGGNLMQLRDLELMNSRRERRNLKRLRKARGAERAAEMSAANNQAASTQDAAQNFQQERTRRRAEAAERRRANKQLRARGRRRLRKANEAVAQRPRINAPAAAVEAAPSPRINAPAAAVEAAPRFDRAKSTMSGRDFNAQARGRNLRRLPSPAQAAPVAETGMVVRNPAQAAPVAETGRNPNRAATSMSGRDFNAQARGRNLRRLPSPAQAAPVAETGMVVRNPNRAATSMSGRDFNAQAKGRNLRQRPSSAHSNTGMSVARSSGGTPPPRGRTAPLMVDGPPRSKPLMLEGPSARLALEDTSASTGRRRVVRPTAAPQLRGPDTPLSVPAPTARSTASSAASASAGGKGMGRFGKLGLGAAALAALYGAKKYSDSRKDNRAG